MKKFILTLTVAITATTAFAVKTNVSPGTKTLYVAVSQSSAGDTLVLADGIYNESSSIKPAARLCIMAADGAKPVLKMGARIETMSDLTLDGLTLEGSTTEAIRMISGGVIYNMTMKNCRLSGYTGKTIRVYDSGQNSPYIDKLTVDNCVFKMVAGERAIEASAAHKQVNNVSIKNSTFDGGKEGTGRILYVCSEEGTTIKSCIVDHCTFYNSNDTRGIYLANINGAQVTNSIFMNATEVAVNKGFCLYGSESAISNCISCNASVYGSGYSSTKVSNANPRFVGAGEGNFMLYKNSPAVGAGTDGSNLGDPRWGVSTEDYDTSDDPYIPYKKPYSMAPTTNSVKVLWQMSEETQATEAVVKYGTDKENLDHEIISSDGWNVEGEGYVHVVTLTGLEPFTRYYFTVGNNKQRFDMICSTKTAPLPGTAYRIYSISDIHGNACNNWSNQQDFICALNPDIALMNGDFVSSKGNDRNWNSYYFTPGQKFLAQVPVMSSPGNHETGDPQGYRWSSFYDYFHQFSHGTPEDPVTDPRGESYFHFEYGNADIIIINLNGDESSPDFMPGSKQYQWADSILNACTQPWIIICHHVGMWTTGYHGQWSDEPKQFAPLIEKYAAKGKRIIALSGDDHSFEHLYKDGVHYVRPGCGRNANYNQQKQLKDFQYSMFYRKVSCFSTLDMAADASEINLTAYDSVGTVFYTYKFLHDNEVITPSVAFISPNTGTATEDSVKLTWSVFDPNKDAKVAIYYSQSANETTADGMTLIAKDLNTDRLTWQTRDIYPKGQYYVYAAVTSGGNTYLGQMPLAITLMDDTTPPPAPNNLTGYADGEHYVVEWSNPTKPVHLSNMLADFSDGQERMQAEEEDGATMKLSVSNNALKAEYNITGSWKTSAANLVFTEPLNMSQTPTLSFRMKGDGTSTPLRLVCKNMSSGHEDWWYTEDITLKTAAWNEYTINLRNLSAFTWYANSDTKNQLEGVKCISFSISTGNNAAGTFYLDDIQVSGDINPAPDFAETVVLRKDDSFPTSPTDGTEVYRGKAERVTDTGSDTSKTYFYAAFASDDRNNWSAAEETAQWCTTEPYTAICDISASETVSAKKNIRNGHIIIMFPDGRQYTLLGQNIIL
ncbi:MAG: CIA30 family protein [Paludibacteraceae bacterium]|nr:CIA30 family protein [Paludibacteraceae bacterium]